MDSNQPTSSTPPFTPAPPPPPPPPSTPAYTAAAPGPGIFGTMIPSTVAFAIAILMFLLPFSEIRCGSQPLMNNSGIGFAMGSDWKMAGGYGKDMLKDMGGTETKTTEKKAGNSQYFILGALALGIIGLVLAVAGGKTGGRVGMIMGVLAAAALIAFMFDLKKWFNEGMAKQASEKATDGTDSLGLGKLGDVKLTMAFTPWFFVAIVAFLAASFFCYKRSSRSTT